MIPDEAVEAAYEAFWEDGEGDSRAFLRKALEAAAPHMLAHAWDVGCESALMHIAPVNPYRGKA